VLSVDWDVRAQNRQAENNSLGAIQGFTSLGLQLERLAPSTGGKHSPRETSDIPPKPPFSAPIFSCNSNGTCVHVENEGELNTSSVSTTSPMVVLGHSHKPTQLHIAIHHWPPNACDGDSNRKWSCKSTSQFRQATTKEPNLPNERHATPSTISQSQTGAHRTCAVAEAQGLPDVCTRTGGAAVRGPVARISDDTCGLQYMSGI
jgi:hypothetical protein